MDIMCGARVIEMECNGQNMNPIKNYKNNLKLDEVQVYNNININIQ